MPAGSSDRQALAAAARCESPAISQSHLWHRFVCGSCRRLTAENKAGSLVLCRKCRSKSRISRGEPTPAFSAQRSGVLPVLVVNRNSARFLEMVFPLHRQIPPHYFGVPGNGGSLKGEKRRRTLRRFRCACARCFLRFDGKRRTLFAAGDSQPLHTFALKLQYRRLRRWPDFSRSQKGVAVAGRRQACR